MAKKRFCVRGHDTLVVGRNSNGTCRECKRFYERVEGMTPEQHKARKARKRLCNQKNLHKWKAKYNAKIIRVRIGGTDTTYHVLPERKELLLQQMADSRAKIEAKHKEEEAKWLEQHVNLVN